MLNFSSCHTDVDPEEASKTALHYAEVLREIDDKTNNRSEDAVSYTIELIMRKASLATHQKLKELAPALNLSDVIVDRTWAVMEHLFNNEDQYQLLTNRGIDVALLCTIFAVARVSDIYLPFTEILNVYRGMPLHAPEALAGVPLPHGRTGDIVVFYNEVYLPNVKSYIAEEVGNVGCFG
jgi:hypothetical protein